MIGEFFAWWGGQLAELLPSWLHRSSLTGADALVIVPKALGARDPNSADDVVAASLRRNGKEVPLGEFAPDAPELGQLPQSPSRPAVLRLASADVLQKELTLPLAAQAELDQVLGFEMDRETPFAAQEVYWSHRVEAVDRQQRRLSVRLSLVPKGNLAPLLSALARAGVAPRWAEFGDGSSPNGYLPLDGARGRPQDRSQRLVWPAAACCALLALGAVVVPFARQTAELAALDRAIAVNRKTANQAEALRRDIDGLSHSAELVNGELDKAGRPLEALAALTRLLPDDTYLTELDLRQRKLTLSGRSAGAARLIGVLAADPEFRNPAFAAPVTRLEALHTEVFSIVADVGP